MTNMSDSIGELAKALSIAQGVLENVHKDSKGYGYTYSSLASCLDAIKVPLRDNGLSISHVMEVNNGENCLATYLLHTSGEWLKSTLPIIPPPPPPQDNNKPPKNPKNPMQDLGSSISYARRYALSAIIGLAQADDDGTGNANKTKDPVKENPIEERKKLARQVAHLCLEHEIDPKSFGDFHKLSEQGVAGLTRVIENFDGLAMEFMSFAEGEDE